MAPFGWKEWRLLVEQSGLPHHLLTGYMALLSFAGYHSENCQCNNESRDPLCDGPDLKCWPSIARLVRLLKKSRRMIQFNLRELEVRGSIKKEARMRGGRPLSNIYHILARPQRDGDESDSDHHIAMENDPHAILSGGDSDHHIAMGSDHHIAGVAITTSPEVTLEAPMMKKNRKARGPDLDLIGQKGRERAMNETQEQRKKTISRWPTTLETATDLAGFLRRKMESVGGELVAFKVAERCLKALLADGNDPYEVAWVYNAAINVTGPMEQVWNLLDPRAYARLKEGHAPMKGVARYLYLAHFADVSADNQEAIYALIEDLEDTIVAEARTTERLLRADLDERLLGLLGRPVTDEAERGG